MSVTAGPRVRVAITGAHLSKGQFASLCRFMPRAELTKTCIQEGRRNIRDYFQRQGYFNADVQVRSQTGGKELRVIVYEVSRGDKFRLVGIQTTGNKYFGSDLLASRLQIQTASFASSGRFSQQLLRADVDSIRALVHLKRLSRRPGQCGRRRQLSGKKGNLFVAFHIVEGPQTRVASLEIEVTRAISTDMLLGVVGSTPGQPYSTEDVASDRNNILALYYNEGFPESAFPGRGYPSHSRRNRSLGKHFFRPSFVSSTTSAKGEQIEVAKVLLTGYQYTRPGIIARQVQIHARAVRCARGTWSKRNGVLYNLGVFTRVQMLHRIPTAPIRTKSWWWTRRKGGVTPSATASATNSANRRELQHLKHDHNLRSKRHQNRLQPARHFRNRASQHVRPRTNAFLQSARQHPRISWAALTYTADNFLTNSNLSLQLTGFAEKTQDVTTFTSTRYEGALQLAHKLSHSSALLYRYFYRRRERANLKVTLEEIPLLSQPTLVSGFGITYARDHRDNPGRP